MNKEMAKLILPGRGEPVPPTVIFADKRTKRLKTRAAQRKRAIDESRN